MRYIVEQGFAVAQAVEQFKQHVRPFFYRVMLSAYLCPSCSGRLEMLREGRCQCERCGRTLDPTVAFQRCGDCGGKLELRVRRYCCRGCGRDVQSRFLFDGLVFDSEYFREKMAESRQRKQSLREQVRQMLADGRSAAVSVSAADLGQFPDLMAALDELTLNNQDHSDRHLPSTGERFDLSRYQRHIEAHLQPFPIVFTDIPPLSENRRKDLVWRLIAILFMDQAGTAVIWQQGKDIMVQAK
jgi:hypothetical protein